VGKGEASKRVMGPTPDVPVLRDREKSLFPIPIGEITPMPVITTRFFTDFF
jgi:hypothetical protein